MFIRSLLLRDPGAVDGAGTPPVAAPVPIPAPAPGNPAPPQAAETVLTGTRTEIETKLEADLETDRGKVKERETKIAQLEDQLSILRQEPERYRMFKV